MTNKVVGFVKKMESEQFATTAGLVMHAKLQFVCLGDSPIGDKTLIQKIESSDNELKSFFTKNAKTEVPVAGVIGERFISRRIDRLIVDDNTKTVRVLDYKTDTDTEKFRQKYIAQLNEYSMLLRQIYPGYKILCYILWLHEWRLEKL